MADRKSTAAIHVMARNVARLSRIDRRRQAAP
jgi:hypothetical protein